MGMKKYIEGIPSNLDSTFPQELGFQTVTSIEMNSLS